MTLSIFTTQLPAGSYDDSTSYEMGVRFTSSITSIALGIRFYKAIEETGSHTGHLWDTSGNKLATASFINETASGWQYAYFITPVLLAANAVYTASVNINTYFSYTNYELTSPIVNGYLSSLAGGGYYGDTGTFPTGNYHDSNYYVDVVTDLPLQWGFNSFASILV